MEEKPTMTDLRCPACKRLLAKADVRVGIIEIKCYCGKVIRFTIRPQAARIKVNELGMGIEGLDPRADGLEPQPLPEIVPDLVVVGMN